MLIKSYEKVIIDTSLCCIFILIRFIYKSLHRLLRANEAIFFLPILFLRFSVAMEPYCALNAPKYLFKIMVVIIITLMTDLGLINSCGCHHL